MSYDSNTSDVVQKTNRERESWAYDCASELCDGHAELGWEFVLQALSKATDPKILAVLAAGPLEDLLVVHGPKVIERVEAEARRDTKFRHLLGGVWKNSMSDDIWQRVLQAAPERW